MGGGRGEAGGRRGGRGGDEGRGGGGGGDRARSSEEMAPFARHQGRGCDELLGDVIGSTW